MFRDSPRSVRTSMFLLFIVYYFSCDIIVYYAENQYLCIPFARTNYYKSSFSVYGPSIWNKIPLNIREAQNVHTFKILLSYI